MTLDNALPDPSTLQTAPTTSPPDLETGSGSSCGQSAATTTQSDCSTFGATVRFCRKWLRVTVRDPAGRRVLTATLPLVSRDPSALPQLLDAIARHIGRPVGAVVSATGPSLDWLELAFLDPELPAADTDLLRVEFDVPRTWLMRSCGYAFDRQLQFDFSVGFNGALPPKQEKLDDF